MDLIKMPTATHGGATGPQPLGQAFLAQMENRSSFHQVSKLVPSSATADRAGTTISFKVTINAVVWSIENTGTDQAFIQRPTAAGSSGKQACQRIDEPQRFKEKAALGF